MKYSYKTKGVCSRQINVEIENNKIIFDRNVISEREHNKITKGLFIKPECWECQIPVDGTGGEQHVGILKNFASAVLNGTELLAPGEEGINGLTISNAIHLSGWTGEVIYVKNFPHKRFYDLLEEKRRG